MVTVLEATESFVYDILINDEYPEEKYAEVSLYDPTEDWMQLQLDYAKVDNNHIKFYGTGGIVLNQTTLNSMNVYIKDMDSTGEEHFLFSWDKSKDNVPYNSDGDYEISADFAWRLAHEVDKIF